MMPDVDLVMRKEETGKVVDAQLDAEFNRNKGNLFVEFDNRTVSVRIDTIEPRAHMKVTILYSGMLNLGVEINRAAKTLVPFDFDDLQDRCFQA